jgi:hypothetical protein
VEGDSIKGGALGPLSLEMHVISYWGVPNVFCDFFLILLINKDEGVVFGVLPVIKHPLPSRVVSLIFVTANGDVRRGGGGRRDLLEERRRLILLLYYFHKVLFDEVGECEYVSEVGDSIVFAHSDREGEVDIVLALGSDRYHEVIGRPAHDRGKLRIHRSIVANGSTQSDGPIDLFIRREDGLEFCVVNCF